ncbi:MAG TPA: RNB domain-containing ribonuclease [Burkholderiales bacterium]|jgi:exoribonuclease-2|nr:RNB domain-containing ribonuclease [Burkholderiales bacterium]
MNVFYEEEGALKVGAVLADNTSSLQVEAPHGKRSKIKASAVLFRFEQGGIADFMAHAQRAAEELDLDFLWQCSSGDEFGYETLAREYYGHTPAPAEAAGVLMKLHGAPMYFYKRGRGRYKGAPEDALKAALASVERKKQQAAAKDAYVAQLTAGELPPEFVPLLDTLLYRPDKGSIEWKALEEASAALRLTPVRVIERCGGLASTHDYHLRRFLFEYFPNRDKDGAELATDPPPDLPLSDVAAFSIDDASTTEIDDAFSVAALPNGNARFGIHIAAPALGLPAQGMLDALARERLSTVYFPGGKITMLPPAAIQRYTLAAGCDCPAVSLYTEVTPAGEAVQTETRVERVRIAENLRHEALEPLFNEGTVDNPEIEHAYGVELKRLWQWARQLERQRRGDVPEGEQRPEYSFRVDNDRIQIVRRMRGTPIDKLVSEMMIYVNSTWGRQLALSETGAIYRVQGGGKVRMSTVPSAHVGLGVEQYVWASSPLRRYVDLVNQRQIAALARGEAPPYRAGDEVLLAVMREFESAYDAYSEFQRSMERYWCLRWLLQENVGSVEATVLRENLCRFDDLPLVARVASLPALRSGTRVVLDITEVDLLELTFHCEFRHEIERAAASTSAAIGTGDPTPEVVPAPAGP